MTLKLVITGITMMHGDDRCISGYSLEEKRYYRPCLPMAHFKESLLVGYGKEFGVFSEVVFKVQNVIPPEPPHIEDINVYPGIVSVRNFLSGKQQIEFLHGIADKSIVSIYGDYIESVENHFVIPEDCGKRSLGTIIAKKCKLYLDNKGKTRVDVQDQTGYEMRNLPCVARDAEYRPLGLFHDIPVRLSLTRAWKKEDMDEAFYWIQCSGVFAG